MCIKKATDMKVCLIICLAIVGSSGQAAEDYQIHRQSRMYRSAKASLEEPKGFRIDSDSRHSRFPLARASPSEPKGFRIDSDSRTAQDPSFISPSEPFGSNLDSIAELIRRHSNKSDSRTAQASPKEPKEDTPRDKTTFIHESSSSSSEEKEGPGLCHWCIVKYHCFPPVCRNLPCCHHLAAEGNNTVAEPSETKENGADKVKLIVKLNEKAEEGNGLVLKSRKPCEWCG